MVLANRFPFFTPLMSPKLVHGMGCVADGIGPVVPQMAPYCQEGLCPQSITALPSQCTLRSETPSHTASDREQSPSSQSDLELAVGEKSWKSLGHFFPSLLNFGALCGMMSAVVVASVVLFPWSTSLAAGRASSSEHRVEGLTLC